MPSEQAQSRSCRLHASAACSAGEAFKFVACWPAWSTQILCLFNRQVRTQMRCSQHVFALVRNFACMHIYMYIRTSKPRSACVRIDDPISDGQLHYVPGSRRKKYLCMNMLCPTGWSSACLAAENFLPKFENLRSNLLSKVCLVTQINIRAYTQASAYIY